MITDAALGVVTQLESRIKGLLAEVQDLKLREDQRDRQDEAARRALLRHHQWDVRLVAMINEHLPVEAHVLPPPPLVLDSDWMADEFSVKPNLDKTEKDKS